MMIYISNEVNLQIEKGRKKQKGQNTYIDDGQYYVCFFYLAHNYLKQAFLFVIVIIIIILALITSFVVVLLNIEIAIVIRNCQKKLYNRI